jgi:sirohydrochlorin ferrochelatase
MRMRIRIALMVMVCAIATPAVSVATDGVLVLAHNGTPEWNAQIKDLVAKVDAKKTAEVVFGVPTSSSIAPAVDRLAKRGVTNVIAVPFFLTVPIAAEHVTGHVIPVKIGSAPLGDEIFAQVVMSRKASEEVLVLVGYGSEDLGTQWHLDLGPTARRLNGMRRFSTIVSIARPDTATDREKQQIRVTLERNTSLGRRILVVPVLPTSGEADSTIEHLLEGFAYDTVPGGIISDDRVANRIADSSPSR